MTKHIVLYSHGFGVRKNNRGLFTDIAKSLSDYEHIMFDYNQFDDVTNTLNARPLDQQVKILLKHLKLLGKDVSIDLVAHSQGCVVAALASPSNIRAAILLAPPAESLGLKKKDVYLMRPGTKTGDDGRLYMPRRDGTTTIIGDDYFKSNEGIKPIELYNRFAGSTNLTIITATKDEVLSNASFTDLSKSIELIELETNHDFTDTRPELCEAIRQALI